MERISAVMRELWEEEDRKIVPFRKAPITGGKSPPTDNWLDDLPMYSTFVSGSKKEWTEWLEEYTILGRDKDVGITLLRENLREGSQDKSREAWVLTSFFCRENHLKKEFNE
jgi:hypothetical protein